jgi:hypothetical protein
VEKEAIYSIIQQLHDWYVSENFLIVKVKNATTPWAIERLPGYSGNVIFPLNGEAIYKLVERKISELADNGLCHPDFIETLRQRLDENRHESHLGMILSNHEWGDNLRDMMASKDFLDYLPSFDAEGNNPVFERNATFSDEKVKDWHKNRITIINDKNAEYNVLYTEVGLAVESREKAFFTLSFFQSNDVWRINDISIVEVNRQTLIEFYEKNCMIF